MLDRIPTRVVGALFLVISSFCSARGGNPVNERLTFTGASVPGATAVTFNNGVYSFQYSGDENLTYTLDLNDPKVKGGRLSFKELTSDSIPLDGAGVIYHDLGGLYWFPNDLYSKTSLVGHYSLGTAVVIDYSLVFNGVHPYRVIVGLVQKQLLVRVIDPTGNLSNLNNFSGFYFGQTSKVETPRVIHMQGAVAEPIVLFRNGSLHFFTANMLDMFQSNASDYGIVDAFHPEAGADWIKLYYDTIAQYKPGSNGLLAAPLDDTFIVIVTSKIKDALLTSTAPPSPYHLMLSTRMFFDAPEKVWSYYSGMFDLYESLGMNNLAGYFFNWSAGGIDSPAGTNVGPDWAPALDQANFQAMLAKGTSKGALLGAYSSFNCLPPGAPPSVADPANLVKDAFGNLKYYQQLGFPLLSVEASAVFAASESSKMHALGMNAAYLDIHTYGTISKGPDGDHLDQQASTLYSKSNRRAFVAQKNWFESLRSTMQGPLMGEGSIATQNTNMEFLWHGYVDSVQRVINTGSGKQALDMATNSPDTPSNWPIIPEYEWRVAASRQVNHGNGFYERFFNAGDGSTIVNSSKQIITPLSQEARDLYNAMAIVYGHAGFIETNGTQTPGAEGYVTHAAAADTYFMTNALQAFYFLVPVAQIYYYYQGSFKTFEQVVFKTENTDAFRHIPILVVFKNGMHLYVNSGGGALSVTENNVTYSLPGKTGWLAYCPGFITAFSAIPPTTGGKRIDYCNATGQYEYFNGRGAVTGYGSLSNPNKTIQYKVFSSNLTVTQDASGDLQPVLGAAPTLVQVDLVAPEVSTKVDGRLGVLAIGSYSNNSFRDLTTLVKWTSSNPLVATVNSSGVVEARGTGIVTIGATAPGSVLVNPVTITIH